ncbi:hypothetical protein RhiJN_22960 [Ceratobasidium sp. AG-Ba]|nr:hypothetical protein RhiJN_22960 [Ceratobasidium sp. AG-Ba]
MPDSPPRKVLGRERRPTQRLNDYDRAQGRLATLSKSVGRPVTPPTAQAEATDRAKKTSGCRRHIEDEQDELEDDDDDEAGPRLLDYRLEDLDEETDRIEWLLQNMAKLSRHNYRNDPHYQTELSLVNKLNRLRLKGSTPSIAAPTAGAVPRVQTGATSVLKPQTSGHSSRVQLLRTDNTTIGLDGARVASQIHREYGFPSPAKLSRTNSTTIGLDGEVVSPPPAPSNSNTHRKLQSSKAAHPREAAPPTTVSRSIQPSSTKRPHPDDPAPSKKRAIIPQSRIEALCKEKAGGSSTPAAPVDIEMQDPPSDEQGGQPAAGTGDRPPTPPSEDDDLQGEHEDHDGDTNARVGGSKSAKSKKKTKRQRTQLGAFPPEARDLVQWVAEEVKADIASVCPFGDVFTVSPQDGRTYVEHWVPRHWDKANERFREGQPPLVLQDDYIGYIRNQASSVRHMVKRAADPLVTATYSLCRVDPRRTTTAKSLTDAGGERWASPNLENDKDLFKHPVIADTIEHSFFKCAKSLGFKHIGRFTPLVPLPTVALICTILRHSIKSLEPENNQAVDLDASTDGNMYTMFLGMLEDIGKKHPVRLLAIRTKITKQYLNAWPKPTVITAPEMNLGSKDEQLDIEELEEISDMLPEDAPGFEEWDEVRAILDKGKGKAPLRSGASGSRRN